MKLNPLRTLAQGTQLFQQPPQQQPLDVLIVGAGWAGLGAARHLLEHNNNIKEDEDIDTTTFHNFAILEGRTYVGGRSRTQTLRDGITTAEVGSQWVQGATPSNPVYQATLDSGTAFARCASAAAAGGGGGEDDGWSNAVWVEEEEKGGQKISRRLTKTEHDTLVHDLFEGPEGFFAYQANLQDKGEADRSLRDVADEYIATRQAMSDVEVRALEWMLDSFLVDEYAASLQDLSHWWWDADDELVGGDIYLAQNEQSGYSRVVDHVAAPFVDKIHLETKVTAVDWTERPIRVNVVDGSRHQTTPPRTETILANNVIITVPLGVLKAGSIEFIPNLPADKLEAIDKLGMGLLNKCTLLWDETDSLPWPKDKEWIQRIAAQDEDEGYQGRWTEFYSPAPLNGRPLLYAYSSGRMAQRVEDDCADDDEQIKKEVLDVLSSMFFGGSKSSSTSRRRLLPEPRQVLISRWGEDEFSRGSYSFHQVGSTPEHRKILGRPLKNRLYFAGEATDTKHFATTQGALMSGIQAAKNIIASKQRNCDKGS